MSTCGFAPMDLEQRMFMMARRSAIVSGAAFIPWSLVSGSSGSNRGLMFQRSSSAAIRSLTLGFGWVSQSLLRALDADRLWHARAVTNASADSSTGSNLANSGVFWPRTKTSSRFLNGGVDFVSDIPGIRGGAEG